jgi:hypothetical protein
MSATYRRYMEQIRSRPDYQPPRLGRPPTVSLVDQCKRIWERLTPSERAELRAWITHQEQPGDPPKNERDDDDQLAER